MAVNNASSGVTRAFFWLVVSLTLVQIFVAHQIATAGKQVSELEVRAENLRAENNRLKEIISQQGSLVVVRERAQNLGFKPAKDIFYLTSEIPVALNR